MPYPLARWSLAASSLALAMPAAAQDRPLTVAMHYTQEQAAPLLACLDGYGANGGVGAEYRQITYGDYLQTVLTGRLAGQAPDIYNVYSIWAAQMVDNGVLDTPPDDVAQFVTQGYGAGTVGAATIGGTLWGVPGEVSAYMLVSNMRLLRAAGFDAPPTTWEEMKKVAQAVTTRNDQGRIETAGFAFADSSSGAGVVHPFYALLFSEGGTVYADDFSEAHLDSPEAAAALGREVELIRDGITDLSVDAYDFPAGGIGMMVMANWLKSEIQAGFGDDFAQDVAVSQIPMGDDWRTLQYAFFMGVDSASDRKAEAWELVRYLNAARDGGASCMGKMLEGLGALTANKADLAAMPAPDAFTAPYVAALDERAISQPNVVQASEIEGMMAQAFERAMAGDEAPEAALVDLDAEVEDILAEFN